MRVHVAAVVALVGLSACGTTVPSALQTSAPTSDGFSVPTAAPTSLPGHSSTDALAGPGGLAPVVPGGPSDPRALRCLRCRPTAQHRTTAR